MKLAAVPTVDAKLVSPTCFPERSQPCPPTFPDANRTFDNVLLGLVATRPRCTDGLPSLSFIGPLQPLPGVSRGRHAAGMFAVTEAEAAWIREA
jgi:hypothetical protein